MLGTIRKVDKNVFLKLVLYNKMYTYKIRVFLFHQDHFQQNIFLVNVIIYLSYYCSIREHCMLKVLIYSVSKNIQYANINRKNTKKSYRNECVNY